MRLRISFDGLSQDTLLVLLRETEENCKNPNQDNWPQTLVCKISCCMRCEDMTLFPKEPCSFKEFDVFLLT